MAQEVYDYAADLFGQCVWGDPGNRAYVQSFLAGLQKKYANNRKGSSMARFQGFGLRSAIKKAVAQNDWEEVIKNGLAVLKVNPWDIPALMGMATAAEKLATMILGEYIDCQWLYLKTAAETNAKDPTCAALPCTWGSGTSSTRPSTSGAASRRPAPRTRSPAGNRHVAH